MATLDDDLSLDLPSMQQWESFFSILFLHQILFRSDPLVTSDVYSRSLRFFFQFNGKDTFLIPYKRFSHIERPEFIIDRSSPLMQKRFIIETNFLENI